MCVENGEEPRGANARFFEKANENVGTRDSSTAQAQNLDPRLARILGLIPRRAGETAQNRRRRNAACEELQAEMAREFGAARGWYLSHRDFSTTVLARRGVSGAFEVRDLAFLDHAEFYRSADRRAAAIVAHLYEVNEKLAEEWAAERALRVSFSSASWWYPGWTILALFEPAP